MDSKEKCLRATSEATGIRRQDKSEAQVLGHGQVREALRSETAGVKMFHLGGVANLILMPKKCSCFRLKLYHSTSPL